jgi:hypothetical protein
MKVGTRGFLLVLGRLRRAAWGALIFLYEGLFGPPRRRKTYEEAEKSAERAKEENRHRIPPGSYG